MDKEVTPEGLLGKFWHNRAHKEGDMRDGRGEIKCNAMV